MVEIKLLRHPFSSIDRKSKPSFQQGRSSNVQGSKIEIDLWRFKMTDLDRIAHALEKPKITTLQLFNRPYKQHNFDIVRFDFADPTTAKAFLKFSRALARALGAGGWLQQLELGFQIWRRDVKVLPEALSSAATLRRLSFANSALGDERLQLLAQGICGCSPLQILDLSGCALTDASRVSLASILKMQSGSLAYEYLDAVNPRPKHRSFSFIEDSRHLTCPSISCRIQLPAKFATLYNWDLLWKGNQLRRRSARMFLSVYEAWGVLRTVDLRNNLDQQAVGVLENGEHLSCFSAAHVPFWTDTKVPPSQKKASTLRNGGVKGSANIDPITSESSPSAAPNCRTPTPSQISTNHSNHTALIDCSKGELLPVTSLVDLDRRNTLSTGIANVTTDCPGATISLLDLDRRGSDSTESERSTTTRGQFRHPLKQQVHSKTPERVDSSRSYSRCLSPSLYGLSAEPHAELEDINCREPDFDTKRRSDSAQSTGNSTEIPTYRPPFSGLDPTFTTLRSDARSATASHFARGSRTSGVTSDAIQSSQHPPAPKKPKRVKKLSKHLSKQSAPRPSERAITVRNRGKKQVPRTSAASQHRPMSTCTCKYSSDVAAVEEDSQYKEFVWDMAKSLLQLKGITL